MFQGNTMPIPVSRTDRRLCSMWHHSYAWWMGILIKRSANHNILSGKLIVHTPILRNSAAGGYEKPNYSWHDICQSVDQYRCCLVLRLVRMLYKLQMFENLQISIIFHIENCQMFSVGFKYEELDYRGKDLISPWLLFQFSLVRVGLKPSFQTNFIHHWLSEYMAWIFLSILFH